MNKKGNKYDLSKEYGIGYDSNNNIFYFDLEDYDLIKYYTWNIHDGYARTTIKDNAKYRQILMHRLVMNVINDYSCLIDHINCQRNDNRKNNLRKVNYSENMANSQPNILNTSGVKGVNLEGNHWRSRITVNGKRISLGLFDNFDEAVKAREKAEKKYYGEYNYIKA